MKCIDDSSLLFLKLWVLLKEVAVPSPSVASHQRCPGTTKHLHRNAWTPSCGLPLCNQFCECGTSATTCLLKQFQSLNHIIIYIYMYFLYLSFNVERCFFQCQRLAFLWNDAALGFQRLRLGYRGASKGVAGLQPGLFRCLQGLSTGRRSPVVLLLRLFIPPLIHNMI